MKMVLLGLFLILAMLERYFALVRVLVTRFAFWTFVEVYIGFNLQA